MNAKSLLSFESNILFKENSIIGVYIFRIINLKYKSNCPKWT